MRNRPLRTPTLFAAFALLSAMGSSAGATPVDYVIQISVDALRGDLLRDLIVNSPATYPNFARLQAQAAYTYNARTDFDFTETIPNHATMLTSRPVLNPAGEPNTVGHGYSNNFPESGDTLHAQGNPNVPYKSSVFDVVHDHGLSTELLASKTRFQVFDTSYNQTYGAHDLIGADHGRDKIDFTQLVNTSSASIVNTLVANMTATPYNFTFLHLVEPDGAGHSGGWGNAAWNASVAVIDSRLGQIFNLIDNNPTLLGHTAITLTADHGGGVPTSGHSTITAPENYTIPMFIWGAGLPAGSDLYSAFSNRFDPGSGRPDYNAAPQPLRNGDTGNISLLLLGLESIPGSLMQPEPSPFPGDANGDKVVDFTDLGILLNNYNQNGSWSAGDFDDSNTVDFSDLGILLNNYNQSAPVVSLATAVPEPSARAVGCCAAFALMAAARCQRRRRVSTLAPSACLATAIAVQGRRADLTTGRERS